MSLINWVHVARLYLPVVFIIVIAVLLFQIGSKLHAHGLDAKFWSSEVLVFEFEKYDIYSLGWRSMLLLATILWYLQSKEQNVYLVDFTCFESPKSWRLTGEELLHILKMTGSYTEESLKFSEKILAQSGVGDETAWPPSIIKSFKNGGTPYKTGCEEARRESETVIFDCVRKLLERTKTHPKSVDFLVINCSLFSPTPSLCSMVINEFSMRSDISAYNLSGMVS